MESAASIQSRSFPASVGARDATPLAFRVDGTLDRLEVEMGGTVKKGQLIARVDQGDYKIALAQARANYKGAETDRNTSRLAFQRAERLFEAGSATQADYESARGQLQAAEAQLSAAGQQVQQARNQLDYTELRAPFDGVVNSVPVKNGESIGAGKTVAVVSRGGELEVTVGVPERLVTQVKVGAPAEVKIGALGGKASLSARVREVGFDSENSTYPVRLSLDNPPAALRPGMAAQVEFKFGEQKSALRVPASAVGHVGDDTFVFALEPAGDQFVVRRRVVKLGSVADGEFEVLEGLSEGDKVASAGLATLLDGMTVRLLGAEGKTASATPEATPEKATGNKPDTDQDTAEAAKPAAAKQAER